MNSSAPKESHTHLHEKSLIGEKISWSNKHVLRKLFPDPSCHYRDIIIDSSHDGYIIGVRHSFLGHKGWQHVSSHGLDSIFHIDIFVFAIVFLFLSIYLARKRINSINSCMFHLTSLHKRNGFAPKSIFHPDTNNILLL